MNSLNSHWGKELNYTNSDGLPIQMELRCNLVSGVAASSNSKDIRDRIKLAAAYSAATAEEFAVSAAVYAANSVAYDSLNACSAAIRAVATADSALKAAVLEELIDDATFMTNLANTQASKMWDEIRRDCFDSDGGRGLSDAKL